jgi:ketosteroid isomerase-like protein
VHECVAMVRIAEHFDHSLHVNQGEIVVLEGGDTALVLANTLVWAKQQADSEFATDRKATYVFRRYPDGKWRCVIDNSYGTGLLR